jgi:hypothetical protein
MKLFGKHRFLVVDSLNRLTCLESMGNTEDNLARCIDDSKYGTNT